MGNIPYDFSYYALLEASPFFNDDGEIFLIDAFVTYSRFDFARVSVGRFKKPMGLELLTACSGLNTIQRTQFVNDLTGPTNRDTGIMILGGNKNSMLSYRLAIMNGGSDGLGNDDKYFDYYGRVDFRPFKNITIGGSYLFGKSESATEGAEDDQKTRIGVDVDYKFSKFRLQSEYMYGEDIGTYTTGGGCSGEVEVHSGSIEREGFYFMGMWDITSQIQPVVKYEQYDTNKSESDDLVQVTTLGVNYFFNDWTRLQINYLYKAEDPREIKNDAILAQVQIKF